MEPPPAQLITDPRTFDLDDVCPEVGKEPRGGRGSNKAAKFENSNSFEGRGVPGCLIHTESLSSRQVRTKQAADGDYSMSLDSHCGQARATFQASRIGSKAGRAQRMPLLANP